MELLNLPAFDPYIENGSDGLKIFDRLRQKLVALTPEEWVRQHFVEFLINHRNFPTGRMANEIGIKLNSTLKRCDTVVFDSARNPLVIIEYKAPNVPITQAVFNQIVRYNMALKARYLIVSNGVAHYCCEVDYSSHSVKFLPDIPSFDSISNP